MSALDDLIAAVESGRISSSLIMNALDGTNDQLHCLAAFDGSLDAAMALHEALLPGWGWKRTVHVGPIASVGVWEPPKFVMGQVVREADGNTARAWLLSILRALKAQEGR